MNESYCSALLQYLENELINLVQILYSIQYISTFVYFQSVNFPLLISVLRNNTTFIKHMLDCLLVRVERKSII